MNHGIKTTEFWITVLGMIGISGSAIVGILPGSIAATVAGIAAASYAISRGLAKLGK